MIEESIKHWWVEHANEILGRRRHLYVHPKLFRMEHATTVFVEEKLRAAGLKSVLSPNTGLMVNTDEDEPADSEVGGERPGRLVFRGDMDALPTTEITGPGSAGTNDDVTYICGHDFHTMITLVTVLAMTEYHEGHASPTPLRSIFQPAEGVMAGGAPEVIAAGALNGAERIFVIHCEPGLCIDHVGTRTGAITSTADTSKVQVYGPGGHTSYSQMMANVVYVLGKLIVDLSSLLSRRVDPYTDTVLTFGSAHSGYAHNAIPSEGSVNSTLRIMDIKTWYDINPLVCDLTEQVLALTGANCTVNYKYGVSPAPDDEYCTTLIAEAMRRVNENAVTQASRSPGGEDFGRYLEHVPGVMARLGCQFDRGDKHDLYRDDLVVDERYLDVGAKFLAGTVARYEDGAQSTMTVRQIMGAKWGKCLPRQLHCNIHDNFGGLVAQKIMVIGDGPAGYEVVLVDTKYSVEATVAEDTGMGGSSVLWDYVPSKAFIVATGIRVGTRRADEMGLRSDFSQHKIDFIAVNECVKHPVQQQPDDACVQIEYEGIKMLQGRDRLDNRDSGHVTHYVTVDLFEDGEVTLEGDLVLIYTGASPRILPGTISNSDRILIWRQVYELEELPEHFIVVGSGVTGAELVSSFIELGVKVVMVASCDRTLSHEDTDVANILEEILLERGADVVRNTRYDLVERIEDGGARVVTSDGCEVFGSHVLMTVGLIPNTVDMRLDVSGVKVTPPGRIHVNRVSRVDVSGIYTVGGCTDLFPLAPVAVIQDHIATHRVPGEGVPPIRLHTVSSAVSTRLEIATVGVPQVRVESSEVPTRVEVFPLAGNPRTKMCLLRHGFVRPFHRKNSGMIIGGAVATPAVPELIPPIVVRVSNQLTAGDLVSPSSAYPLLSGSITEAVRQLMARGDPEQCWHRDWQHDRLHS